MAHLQIIGLTKSFGATPVLSSVDLDVHPTELLAILGASGSGKTTLLRLIAGFDRADAGIVQIDECIVADSRTYLPPERRQIGYVAQEGALFPHLSVGENIAFGLSRRLCRAHHRVTELLALVGLPASFAKRAPQALSGGEQQRVALARALAPSPKLVLLDEPFSTLDAGLRGETRAAVAAALAATGATAMLVTHDQAEALSMGHRVAVLQKGQLAQVSDPVTLYRQPLTAGLARFVGEAVLLPGTAEGGYANCILGQLRLMSAAPEGAIEVLVRPEQIHLMSPIGAAVRARVGTVAFYGHDANVSLLLSNQGKPLTLVARVAGYSCPSPGTEVGLVIDGDVIAFPRKNGG